MSDINKFYTYLEDFKNKLIPVLQAINRDREIQAIERNFEKLLTIKSVNPRLPIEYFYNEGVKPYADQIVSRNAQFFLNFTNSIDSYDVDNYGIDQEHLLIIKQISTVWSHLNDLTKNNIWKYIILLAKIAERIVLKQATRK